MLLMYNELMYNELCRPHSCSPCTTQTFNTTRAHQTDSAMVGSISDRQEKYSLSGWFCGIVWTDRKRTTARPLSILGQVVDISCVPIPGLHTSKAAFVCQLRNRKAMRVISFGFQDSSKCVPQMCPDFKEYIKCILFSPHYLKIAHRWQIITFSVQ